MLAYRNVFGPPGSGSISQRYGYGSYNHLAKIIRKTFIPTLLRPFYDFLSLKNYVNVPSKQYQYGNKQKNFFVGSLKVNDEK